MKKVKVVFKHDGEFARTKSPLCFLENFTGDLNERKLFLYGNDDFRQYEDKRFSVSELELPGWISETEFVSNYVNFRFAIALGMPKDFTRVQFYNFIRLSEKYRFFIGWLLKKHKNTKNAFMRSIVNQVQTWLETENPTYLTPLSPAQFEAAAKYCPIWEAKKISENLYWSF